MKLLHVNIGKPEHIPGHRAKTGIIKLPLPGPVMIGPLGLAGDAVLDKKHHGGPDQAVYIYGEPDYDFWRQELGRDLPPGLFGENLTIAGLESQKMLIGDRLEIGDVVLEVTSPRVPCNTFAARMDDKLWVKRFFAVNRPGVYARVLKTGSVEAGMDVRHIPFAGEAVPAIELMSDYKKPAPDRMRWLLKAPIHRDLVARYRELLASA
ncbi:MAG TPA: MOSC domain-containing protein [Devosiaceae bacterium]|jgi:MOSC domain-containing protein YiiM